MSPLATTESALRRFRAALYPRERWTPSEWAEKCRVLSLAESDEPGNYDFDRTPFWRFPLDLMAQPGIEELVCLKGAQVGWSETCRNWIGYCIDLNPGPLLVLTADQISADNFHIERLEPLLRNTPAVGKHLTGRAWDETKYRIKFDTCWLFLTWAGSKTGVKTRPIRYLICEEPDEYPPFSSTGGDPLSKAEKRLTTAASKGRARSLIGGTPTTRLGNAWKRWEMCAAKYHYWVPCPHCNGYQTLQWKQVKWPELPEVTDRAKKAERVRSDGLAHYVCEHAGCGKVIHDHDKPRMLRRGVWATEDQVVTTDGRVVGPAPKSRRVGFKISGLYSPWVTFGTLAAEWILAQDDPQSLADFINQRLAEPFEEQRAKNLPEFIVEKARGAPEPMLVPKWAKKLITTADTQGTNEQDGHFWYVIRAWGLNFRSQLIDYGVCHSKAELHDRCFLRPIPFEGGNSVTPSWLFVDCGGPRWSEIYQMAQADARVHPTKGSAHTRTWMINERPQRKHKVILWEIDTEQAKDMLHRLMHDPDQTKWLPHSKVGDDYCSQMCSEAKIFDPVMNREVWSEIVRKNNHLWDDEAVQCAVAWRLGMGLPEEPEMEPQPSFREDTINPLTNYQRY